MDRALGLPSPTVSCLPIGLQPQSDVGGLHGFSYNVHQVIVQGVQVCLVAQPGVVGLEGFGGVVLAAVKASVDERLYESPERAEQGGDSKG